MVHLPWPLGRAWPITRLEQISFSRLPILLRLELCLWRYDLKIGIIPRKKLFFFLLRLHDIFASGIWGDWRLSWVSAYSWAQRIRQLSFPAGFSVYFLFFMINNNFQDQDDDLDFDKNGVLHERGLASVTSAPTWQWGERFVSFKKSFFIEKCTKVYPLGRGFCSQYRGLHWPQVSINDILVI